MGIIEIWTWDNFTNNLIGYIAFIVVINVLLFAMGKAKEEEVKEVFNTKEIEPNGDT